MTRAAPTHEAHHECGGHGMYFNETLQKAASSSIDTNTKFSKPCAKFKSASKMSLLPVSIYSRNTVPAQQLIVHAAGLKTGSAEVGD